MISRKDTIEMINSDEKINRTFNHFKEAVIEKIVNNSFDEIESKINESNIDNLTLLKKKMELLRQDMHIYINSMTRATWDNTIAISRLNIWLFGICMFNILIVGCFALFTMCQWVNSSEKQEPSVNKTELLHNTLRDDSNIYRDDYKEPLSPPPPPPMPSVEEGS